MFSSQFVLGSIFKRIFQCSNTFSLCFFFFLLFFLAATQFVFTTSADPVPMQISLKSSLFFTLADKRFTITIMLMKSANPRSDVII